MKNPWLDIPLTDYESHMALPEVGQARLMADIFEDMFNRHHPGSVAVLGCAGGNGFDRISTVSINRVVAMDLNPRYADQLHVRFSDRIPHLELIVGDVQTGDLRFPPVEFVIAGLLLEDVVVETVLSRIQQVLVPGGILGTVVQIASFKCISSNIIAISKSPIVNPHHANGFTLRVEKGGSGKWVLRDSLSSQRSVWE